MRPRINLPDGELIKCWALTREIAKVLEPDVNAKGEGVECIVAKRPNPVKLPDGSELPLVEQLLTASDRDYLLRHMPDLPELKIPYPDDVAEAFLTAFRALPDRPAWEPVILTERRYLWECDQVVGRRWENAAANLRQLQNWLNADRIQVFQRPNVPTAELSIGALIPRADVIKYLDYCGIAHVGERVVEELPDPERERGNEAAQSDGGSWEHHSSEVPYISPPSLARRITSKSPAVEEVLPEIAVGALIDLREVSRRTGISVSMLHEKMKLRSKYRDSSFPPKIKFGEHTVRYSAAAIDRWIQERLEIANESALSASN